MDNISLLSSQEWVATFRIPNRDEVSFGAELIFSPTNGLRLSGAIPFDEQLESNYEILHGVTTDGTALTLAGNFKKERFGYRFNLGQASHTFENYPFHYAVVGVHCDRETKFESFSFNITGAQEFFAPKAHRKHIKFSREPLWSVKTKVGTFELVHTGSLGFLMGDLSSFLYCENEEALGKLQAAFDEIKKEYPDFHPHLKRELDFRFVLKPDEPTDLVAALEACSVVSNLFSILLCGPCRVSDFSAILADSDGNKAQLPIVPAMPCEADTLERCKEENSFHDLPLNSTHVDLGGLIKRWFEIGDEYKTFVSILQNQGKFVFSHSVLSHIVLSATQLEDISYQAGEKRNKYQSALDKNCSIQVRRVLANHLSIPLEDIGVAVSDLRNEISHVGKPKKYLNKLNADQLFETSLCLQVAVLGYVLNRLGVDDSGRDHYQNAIAVRF